MRLVLHPGISSDVKQIMAYYEQAATSQLATEFYLELRRSLAAVGVSPLRFPVREHDLRRANLRRFPYHILFRVIGDQVRILVVRHHRRDPSVGAERR